jgi:lipase maturation factor 1
LHFF